IGSLSPRRIAPIAAGFVAAGFLLMGCSMPVAVISGAVLSGGACGWLLASANSVAACLARPQQAFALLQIVLVALGIVLFFTLPRLLVSYGTGSVFITLALTAGAASLLFQHLPSRRVAAKGAIASSRGRWQASWR